MWLSYHGGGSRQWGTTAVTRLFALDDYLVGVETTLPFGSIRQRTLTCGSKRRPCPRQKATTDSRGIGTALHNRSHGDAGVSNPYPPLQPRPHLFR